MDLNEQILKFFADFIFKNLGIVYTEVTYYQLETRLESAASHFQLTSVDELYRKVALQKDPDVCKYILDIATNNETSFFRDPKVFKTLIEQVFKPLAAAKKNIRIWSAACSTGQEPYSLSMDLTNLKSIYPELSYEIYATDYSSRALEKAKKGIYTQLEVQRGLSAPNLVRYMDQEHGLEDRSGGLWQIKGDIKKHIMFSHFNLLETWNIRAKFDLILCRNVLIYQKPENRAAILEKMSQYLNEGGFLVLGCAEVIPGLDNIFLPIQYSDARFYQKDSKKVKLASNM